MTKGSGVRIIWRRWRHFWIGPFFPKKGKLSAEDKKREFHPEFVRAKRKHSAVESDINALEVHGLDKCPDKGLPAFKRYVALAVLGSNLHRLGKMLLVQDQGKQKKSA